MCDHSVPQFTGFFTRCDYIDPIFSDTIIAPNDLSVKLGVEDFTSEPVGLISCQIVTYGLYLDDRDLLPAFRVEPSPQHSCPIVQGFAGVPAPTATSKDPLEYKIEGRLAVADEWALTSEGPIGACSRSLHYFMCAYVACIHSHVYFIFHQRSPASRSQC